MECFLKIVVFVFLFSGLLVFLQSCKEEEIPTLTTVDVINIKPKSATCGGIITSEGSEPVMEWGVCWSTNEFPTVANDRTIGYRHGVDNFSSDIKYLTTTTTYYVRAYATNSIGTGYGNQVGFTTLGIQTGTVNDIDGNVYNTVTIGTQEWMSENLRVVRFTNGNPIPLVTDGSEWGNLTTPGYCWYKNNAASYEIVYGALYNWYAVNQGNLCPTGWHVPTDSEWHSLALYLDPNAVLSSDIESSIAGGQLKEAGIAHWASPNEGGTNEFDFTALPGGGRVLGGMFDYLSSDGIWWSATEDLSKGVWSRSMGYAVSSIFRSKEPKDTGLSIRCLKD